MNEIVYYDFADMDYASFFLTGFLQNEKNFHYKLVVSKIAPPLLYHPAMYFDSGRLALASICLFKLKLFDNEFYFCIDARDSCEANPRRGRGYHLTLLKRVKYYFKVNYNDEAIRCDPNLSARSNKIIPVPLFFPVKMPKLL